MCNESKIKVLNIYFTWDISNFQDTELKSGNLHNLHMVTFLHYPSWICNRSQWMQEIFHLSFTVTLTAFLCRINYISFHCIDFHAVNVLHYWYQMQTSLQSPKRSHKYWFWCVYRSALFLCALICATNFSGPLGCFQLLCPESLPTESF